jgi:hypothetical protein
MNAPKHLFINRRNLDEVTLIPFGKSTTPYVSVEWLKEWIKENTSNEENQAGVKMTVVDVDELLKAINE